MQTESDNLQGIDPYKRVNKALEELRLSLVALRVHHEILKEEISIRKKDQRDYIRSLLIGESR